MKRVIKILVSYRIALILNNLEVVVQQIVLVSHRSTKVKPRKSGVQRDMESEEKEKSRHCYRSNSLRVENALVCM